MNVICVTLIVFALLMYPSLSISPSASGLGAIGPTPIPSDLLPIPSLSGISPVIPSDPNLGTVSTALPPVSIYSIDKTKSGLVASDPLNNEIKTQQQLEANSGYWTYGGSARGFNPPAPYEFFKDGQGIHIGVQAPSNGTWAGFYAVTPNTDAAVFHAVVTTPVRSIPYQFYNNGLYVQTTQPFINYVVCAAATGPFGTVWAVVSTKGDAIQATEFNVHWVDTSPDQPLTRDCTIVTNGDNYLKVYLDGVSVFESNTLNLQMPGPFNAFLEPQSSYAGAMLDGIYKDYYATSSESIKVTENPVLAKTVNLVSSSGKVLASAPVVSGTATLTIGQYHFPLKAFIKIYDSNGIQLASTSSTVSLFGGDTYTVHPYLLSPIGPLRLGL